MGSKRQGPSSGWAAHTTAGWRMLDTPVQEADQPIWVNTCEKGGGEGGEPSEGGVPLPPEALGQLGKTPPRHLRLPKSTNMRTCLELTFHRDGSWIPDFPALRRLVKDLACVV